MRQLLSVLWLCLAATLAERQRLVSECSLGRATYILTEHGGLRPTGNAQLVIPQQSVAACAEYCSNNRDTANRPFECVGFDYVKSRKSCMLSNDRSDDLSKEFIKAERAFQQSSVVDFSQDAAPATQNLLADVLKQLTGGGGGGQKLGDISKLFGDMLNDSPIGEGGNKTRRRRQTNGKGETGFYMKTCLDAVQSSFISPTTVVSFTRSHQRVLLGATDQIVSSRTLSSCLGTCLEARSLYNFICRSVMYYYDSEDCLLNSLEAAGSSEGLVDEEEGFMVDYFENMVVNAECSPLSTPVYILQVDVEHVEHYTQLIVDVSRFSCENYCTHNRIEFGESLQCRAYAYEEEKSICFLIDYSSKHRRATVTRQVHNVKVYSKMCIEAANVCIRSPSVATIKDYSMFDHTMVVLNNMQSVAKCLAACFDAQSTMHFDCLSVNYNQAKGICQLNTETRLNLADGGLGGKMQPTEDGTHYYDNLCAIESIGGIPSNACTHTGDATYIEYKARAMHKNGQRSTGDGNLRRTFDGVTLETCLQTCETRTDMTCRSADYNNGDQTCTITAHEALLGERGEARLEITADVDHYERKCVPRSQFVCGGLGIAFVANVGLRGRPSWQTLTVAGLSMEECLGLCLQDPAQSCRSVNYLHATSTCSLNNQTTANFEELLIDPQVTYYDNLCAPLPNTRSTVRRAGERARQGQVLGRTFSTRQTDAGEIVVTTVCRYGEMKVIIDTTNRVDGYLFAKNKFAHCRTDIENSDNAMLSLKLPSAGNGHGGGSGGYGGGASGSGSHGAQYGNGGGGGGQYAPAPAPTGYGGGDQQPHPEPTYGYGDGGQGGQQRYGPPQPPPGYSNQAPVQPGYGSGPSVQQPYGPPEPPPTGYESAPHQDPYGSGPPLDTVPSYNSAQPVAGPYDQPSPTGDSSYGQVPSHGSPTYVEPDDRYGAGPQSPVPSGYPSVGGGVAPPTGTYGSEPVGSGGYVSKTRRRREYGNAAPTQDYVALRPSYNQGDLPPQIGYSPHSADCGVVEVSRGRYSAIVVVSTNNIGIPGLVTGTDRFFNVSCDYGGAPNKVQATASMTVQNSARIIAQLQPDGQIYIPSPVRISMKRGETEVATVQLGEQLNMDIEYLPGFRSDLIGVFVRECNATRVHGYAPNPLPLRIIQDGCPLPAVQRSITTGPVMEIPNGFRIPFRAFKFDGGSSVKVTCAIDLCEGECNPTTCMIDGQAEQSFGRKKRSTIVEEDEGENSTIILPDDLAAMDNSTFYNISTSNEDNKEEEEEVLDDASTNSTLSNGRRVTAEAKSFTFTVVEQVSPKMLRAQRQLMEKQREWHSKMKQRHVNKYKESKQRPKNVKLIDDMKPGDVNALQSMDSDGNSNALNTQYAEYMAAKHGQLCMQKGVFLAVLILLAGLCLVQLIVVTIYIVKRHRHDCQRLWQYSRGLLYSGWARFQRRRDEEKLKN